MAKRKGLDKQFPVVVGILSWGGEYLTPMGWEENNEESVVYSSVYQEMLKEKKEALKNA
jgi:hypothetical protein